MNDDIQAEQPVKRDTDSHSMGDVGAGAAVAQGAGAIASVTNITDDLSHDVHGLANPYLGLRAFTFEDHAKYGGRRAHIEQTVATLTAPDALLSLLFITGASGSGKSSFA